MSEYAVVIPDYSAPEAAALVAEYYRDALPLIESTEHCYAHGWIGEEAHTYWKTWAEEWGQRLVEVGCRRGRLEPLT